MSLEDVLASVTPGSPEDALARQVTFDRLPAHVAVIMDGNGRWAAQRHLPRVEGHRAGIESVRETVEGSARLGIQVLTLYAFSVENWKRPAAEVSTLMSLLKRYLRSELNTLLRNNIRFKVIGRFEELSADVQSELKAAEDRTGSNSAGSCGRGAIRQLPLHRRATRSRSPDPNQRRDADQQLPSLADRLRRD